MIFTNVTVKSLTHTHNMFILAEYVKIKIDLLKYSFCYLKMFQIKFNLSKEVAFEI